MDIYVYIHAFTIRNKPICSCIDSYPSTVLYGKVGEEQSTPKSERNDTEPIRVA